MIGRATRRVLLPLAAAAMIGVPPIASAQGVSECYLETGDTPAALVVMRLRPSAADVNLVNVCQDLSDSAASPWFLIDPPRDTDGTVIEPTRVGLDLTCEGTSHGTSFTIWNAHQTALDAARGLCADPWQQANTTADGG